jgi:LysM repeat protein
MSFKKMIRISVVRDKLRFQGDAAPMNFSCDSVKPKAKLHNEDFCFDIETPRGHFFAVLDFASHDYANLNAALKGKLETIVGSFASLDDFSDDLFLGFLAKEINNFVSNLADQSGGPELFFSAALCLVSGNNLAYFLAGNVTIDIYNDEGRRGLGPLTTGTTPVQLGERNLEVPLRDGIDSFTLQDDDIVLITTQGLAPVVPVVMATLPELDPKSICDSLIKASAASNDDRTVVVIGGPYLQRPDATFADASALAEVKTSLALLAARLDALTENEALRKSAAGPTEDGDAIKLEAKISQEIDTLKDDLGSKAASIDLLELDEKVKVLDALLAGKADTADVLGLQRDVLKLGLASPPSSTETNLTADKSTIDDPPTVEPAVEPALISDRPTPSRLSFTLRAAVIVIVVSLVGGLAGGWLHSRMTKRGPEVWSVRASGNQIVISRLDGSNREAVTMDLAEPLNASGEQRFSSFADAKRYLDTITTSAPSPTQTSQANQAIPANDHKAPEAVSEITIKSGDSLKRLAQVYNVTPERLMELNPTITRWPAIRIGQKIFVPAAVQTTATSLPTQPNQAPANSVSPNTTEVTVGPGDSLNELARRFNTTAERLKELNPQMNWPRIQTGQKVIVPAAAPLGG